MSSEPITPHGELLKIAAELARGLQSTYLDDYHFIRGSRIAEYRLRDFHKHLERVDERTKDLSYRIKACVDNLRKTP